MKRITLWTVCLSIIGLVGFFEYRNYSLGYYNLPDDLPPDYLPMSFSGGVRGIFVDVSIDEQRSYRARSAKNVPEYLKDVWSYCRPPSEQQRAAMASFEFEPGEKLVAICTIDVETEIFERAIISSVPNLN